MNDLARPMAIRPDMRERFTHLIKVGLGAVEPPKRSIGVCHDSAKWLSDLVRNRGRHRSKRRAAYDLVKFGLGAPQFALGIFKFRDVSFHGINARLVLNRLP